MTSQERAIDAVLERVTKLEKQNRRLKRAGVAVLVGAVSLPFMGQASKSKTVEANGFILRDNSGSVRATLLVDAVSQSPEMVLLDDKGRKSVELVGGSLVSGAQAGGGLALYDSQGQERGTFLADNSGAYIRLSDSNGSTKTLLRESVVSVFDGFLGAVNTGDKTSVSMLPGQVTVIDNQGFQATMGIRELVTPRTGETHKTSAASLILLAKDGNVIWKAP